MMFLFFVQFLYCVFVQQVPFLQRLEGGEAVAAGSLVVVQHIVAGGYRARYAVFFSTSQQEAHGKGYWGDRNTYNNNDRTLPTRD